MPYEHNGCGQYDPVPLLPHALPCPPSFKGIRGSRGVKLSESDLPCSCESSVNFWFSPCLFSHSSGNVAVNFLLHTALRNQYFSFCLLLKPIWFPEQPSACRTEDKSLSTEALQSLILPELCNFIFHCFHCTQPSSKTLLAWPQTCWREEMTKFPSVWVFSFRNRKNWGWGSKYHPLLERLSKYRMIILLWKRRGNRVYLNSDKMNASV